MRKFVSCFLISAILGSSTAHAAAPTAEQKIDWISHEFDTVARHSHNARKSVGTLFLSAGLLATGAGAYMLARNSGDPLTQGSEFTSVPAATLGIGIVFTLAGGLLLVAKSPYEVDWREGLKFTSELSVDKRLSLLETMLTKRADEERDQRYLGAGLGFGIGTLATAAYFGSDRTPSSQNFLLVGALEFGAGIACLLIRGHFEETLETYHAWSSSDGKVATNGAAHPISLQLAALNTSSGIAPGLGLALHL